MLQRVTSHLDPKFPLEDIMCLLLDDCHADPNTYSVGGKGSHICPPIQALNPWQPTWPSELDLLLPNEAQASFTSQKTALHFAILRGSEEACKILLERGASANLPDR